MTSNPSFFPSLKQKSLSLHQSLKSTLAHHTHHPSSLDKKPTEASQFSNTNPSSINTSRLPTKTVNFQSPAGSHFRPTRNSLFYERRTRNFEVKLSSRVHIFYGLSYVQYDGGLRKGDIYLLNNPLIFPNTYKIFTCRRSSFGIS